jgi:hypothetical protein
MVARRRAGDNTARRGAIYAWRGHFTAQHFL